ncbi:MAG: rhodanese-like domain-containing protein [Actinomycetia bacterium]|nr:rhodanese-like domain-containing protein [Actinomycetes bacterium]
MLTSPLPRRALLAAAAVVAAAAALTGCSSGSDAAAPTAPVQQSVSPAVTLVDVTTAEGLITKGVPVLDVRRPDEFGAGHLEGAVNINLEDPAFAAQVSALDRTGPWVVYCRTGNRSATASAQMEALGFTQLYDMGGGITAWQDAGLPVTTS